MNFTKERTGDLVIESVRLHRAVNEHAAEFKRILLKDIDEGFRKIIVDLTECSYIDSTFLSSLVIALKSVIKLGGSMRIIASHPELLSILDLTSMTKIFKVFKERDEAIRSFK
jgi:anti-anti-sigma factor